MVPEFAEVLAAEEFDEFGVVDGGVLFQGLIEVMEGAAQGGSAPGGVFFGFGHSHSCRFMNVFGIQGRILPEERGNP